MPQARVEALYPSFILVKDIHVQGSGMIQFSVPHFFKEGTT
jgi:hypothetical protein